MNRLRRKLHSQSGAALLLAILMFLLCIMVASSVLAAAASNAGKIKSNRIEQQKYMTLTSAVQLICDDLETATYEAEYEKYEWTAVGEADGGAGDGGAGGGEAGGGEAGGEQQYFHIKQISGDCSNQQLKEQIPLGKWLDHIFFGAGGAGYEALAESTDDTYISECYLKVTLPDNLKGYPYKDESSPQAIYQVDKTVTVWVKIDPATYNITLTAWLGDVDYDPADPVKVTAELTAEKDPAPFINPQGTGAELPTFFTDSTNPTALPPATETNNPITVTKTSTEGTKTIATFTTIIKETLTSKWKLNWIKKGE